VPKIIRWGGGDKLQELQDPNQKIGDNMNNIRHEVSRHFRNNNKRKMEYLKDKINELVIKPEEEH
jgi:hypothetical protein